MWTNKENSWSQKFTYGHKGEVFAISSSKDFKYIYSGGADQKINIWENDVGLKIKQSIDLSTLYI